MPLRILRLPILLLLILLPFGASANFDFNANCIKAYQNIFELKLGTAKALIAAEKKARPQNSIVPLLENYVDYFYLLTTESKSEFERLEQNKSQRLAQISNDDKNSPYYLYAQAEINLQWALIRGRYGAYFAASKEINKANSLLKDNQKKFPSFHLNHKGLGLINVVIGSLPDGFMKSALATFGVKGDVQTGLNQLDNLAENLPKSTYEPFYEEVVFYYAYILSDVAKSPQAYAKTMKYTNRINDSSLLKTYMQAYVCARNGKSEQAIDLLENRPRSNVYQPFPYLDYLLGVVRLNKLDLKASSNFDQFLQSNRGVNYIKDTYLHLAWVSLLKGDSADYGAYIGKVKASGATYADKDKQALNEANSPTPNLVLLKARLLYDGGYLSKAMEVLTGSKADDFKTVKDKTEYAYRLARVNDDLGKDELALGHYQAAYQLGKNQKYYFAAKSAVLMGCIYEKKKNFAKAKAYFNLAMSLKDHEYQNSIENEAKQGLKRVGG
ncbi:tetratricopeptide repeat protein [uncultured Pedobacter sp.]|uniref:tetratricopeptide repeat protein n=1 Tax=uncultured Pedobacter sp. TaxID=246139 RepID=UPI002627149D|nr:tetratricopeptide repeat protein [uncultured Pedobacter sp.]